MGQMALDAPGRARHAGDMSGIVTLTLVRQQLDELAYSRLDSNLGPELGETYRALCDQERELLTKQQVTHS
jgi:hypothetical protein